jgi:hypothetical protein
LTPYFVESNEFFRNDYNRPVQKPFGLPQNPLPILPKTANFVKIGSFSEVSEQV